MKKSLTITGIIVAVILMGFAAYKPVKQAFTEKPVEKSIAFSVYRANNYNAEVYNQTSARVHVIVEKVSKHSRTIVWEKTMDARQLKQYPTADRPIVEKIIVPGIFDKKEHLEVRYVLTYDSRGSQLEMQNGTVVTSGTRSGAIDINI